VHHFVHKIKQGACNSTPPPRSHACSHVCALPIRQKLREKRRLRKKWQTTRSPQHKTAFNTAAKNHKQLLYEEKQKNIKTYLTNLTATDATDFFLWRTTLRLKRPQTPISPLRTAGGEWAKGDAQKTIGFADHFEIVFQPRTTRKYCGLLKILGCPHPCPTFQDN
jgi:hypothetical protein